MPGSMPLKQYDSNLQEGGHARPGESESAARLATPNQGFPMKHYALPSVLCLHAGALAHSLPKNADV